MQLPDWKHGDLDTGSVRLHYVEMGRGDELVLLLHGFPEYHITWAKLMPALAAGRRVVALDLRGYGRSDKPTAGYDLFSVADDLASVITGLGHQQAHLVGHDWGGEIAWTLACLKPQLIDRLVVMNAPHPVAFLRSLIRPRQLRKSWYMFYYQLPWLPEWSLVRHDFKWLERGMRTAAGPSRWIEEGLLRRYKLAFSEPDALRAPLAYYRELPGMVRQYLRRLDRKLELPTLIVWGEQDGSLDPSLLAGTERFVVDPTTRLVPNAGHWVHQDEPEQVAESVLRFLAPSRSTDLKPAPALAGDERRSPSSVAGVKPDQNQGPREGARRFVMLRRWCTEFGPVITFVVAYRLSDFFRATAALMLATTAGLVLAYLRERRVPLFPLLYSISVLCFGAITLWFRESAVLMLQDTLVGAGFGLLVLLSLAAGRPLLKRLFEPLFALSDAAWRILSVRWGGWFLLYALGNELVRTSLSEAAWVRFKAWGLVATAAFGCYQFTVARRERLPGESNAWGMRTRDAGSEPGQRRGQVVESADEGEANEIRGEGGTR